MKIEDDSIFMIQKHVSVHWETSIEKISETQMKRAFYMAARRLAVQKPYREKAAKERQIKISQLTVLKLKNKSSLQLKTIQNLILLLD